MKGWLFPVCVALLLLPKHLPLRMAGEPGLEASTGPGVSVFRGAIGHGESLSNAVTGVLEAAQLHELVEAARPVHDLARVVPGQSWGVALDEAGALLAFTYAIDELRTLRVVRDARGMAAELHERQYTISVGRASGIVSSNLFEAVSHAGEQDQLALDLAEIFAWDIDFNTELRAGDSFRVAVETRSLDGERRGYGRVLAAEFVRGDRVLQAVGFASERGFGYYAPDGTPLRKAFLRSPLRFSRISSRFTRKRFHPVLKTLRPHLGVDYAAPTGTPVNAAADGVVSHAGWKGGYGNAVVLRHANGFETLYGHLSRIHVRRAQRVTQGETIGRVGATGLATGPHLDYRMLRDGVFIDPLKVQSPPAEPLSPRELTVFQALRVRHLGLLPAVGQASLGAAVREPRA